MRTPTPSAEYSARDAVFQAVKAHFGEPAMLPASNAFTLKFNKNFTTGMTTEQTIAAMGAA